jgi:RNA polymerase sigma-70 factor (sigma-E family)
VDAESERQFTEWASIRAGRLQRTAFLLCADWQAAEDLVQECLTQVAVHWRRVQSADSPDAYVRRILVNQARGRWRRRSTHEQPSAVLVEPAVDDGSDTRAVHDELVAALALLPARRRAAVVLRYFEQLSEAETADALGCSVGTVKSQTARALADLRRALSPLEISC